MTAHTGEDVVYGEHSSLLVGEQTCKTTMEINLVVPQKTESIHPDIHIPKEIHPPRTLAWCSGGPAKGASLTLACTWDPFHPVLI